MWGTERSEKGGVGAKTSQPRKRKLLRELTKVDVAKVASLKYLPEKVRAVADSEGSGFSKFVDELLEKIAIPAFLRKLVPNPEKD